MNCESLVTCSKCRGKGKLWGYDDSMGGVPTPPMECFFCEGRGKVDFDKAVKHPDFRPDEKADI